MDTSETKNRTIEYLNEKTWYRLIKVFSLLLLASILVIANLIIFSGGIFRLDPDLTTIQCLERGTEHRTLTASQAGVTFNNIDFINGNFNYKGFFSGYNDWKIIDIFNKCYDTKASFNLDVFAVQRVYEIKGTKIAPRQYSEDYLNAQIKEILSGYKTNDEKLSYLDFSIKLFDVKPAYTINEFLKYFLLANAIILIFFEGIRRLFYYIALGTLIPKKHPAITDKF